MEDDIPLIYDELEIIPIQEWSKLERGIRQTGVGPPLLEEDIMIVESGSTNSIQSKRKLRRSYQNQLKPFLINSLILLNNVSTQKLSIAPISIMTILDSKVKKSAPEPSLMEVSNGHKNEDNDMSEADLLVEREPI